MVKNILKKGALIIICISMIHNVVSQNTAYQYGSSFGGDQGNAVKGLSNGNSIIAGQSLDFFTVINISPTGNMVWSKMIGIEGEGSSSYHEAFDLTILSDGSIVAGGVFFINDVRKGGLAKLSAEGDVLWCKVIDITGYSGFQEVKINSVLKENNDEITVLGVHSSGAAPFIARYSSNGDKLSEVFFESINDGVISSSSIIKTSDGGYIICGNYINPVERGLMLMKLDATYNLIWAKSYENENNRYNTGLSSIVETETGDFIAVGTRHLTAANHQMTMLKVNNEGNTIWAKSLGDSTYINNLSKIIKDGDNFIVSGFGTNNNHNNGSDFNGLLFNTSEEGNILTTKWFKPTDGMIQLVGLDKVGERIQISGVIDGNAGYADILGIQTDLDWSNLCGVNTSNISVESLVFDVVQDVAMNIYSGSLSAEFINSSLIFSEVGEEYLVCEDLGIKKLEESEELFQVYPNPANTVLNINSEKDMLIKIVDILGQTIDNFNVKAGVNSLDVSRFSKGVYFLQSGKFVVKFIKD